MTRNTLLAAVLALALLGAGGAWMGGAFKSEPLPTCVWGVTKWGACEWG